MIGEDGRMNEDAGEALRRPDRGRGPGARRRRRCASEGRISAEEPYPHSVPFSHRSGERIEPLISLQWFCAMDELAKPAIEVVRERPRQLHARALGPGLHRLDGGHPALVRLAPALVGPSAAGLVLRRLRGDRSSPRTSPSAARLRRAPGAAPRPRRARHLVPLGAVAVRDARLARRHPRAARLLPDRRARHGARHHLPLGRADDHDRARVPRRDPVRRRLHHTRSSRPPTAAGCRRASAPGSTRSS